MAEKDGPPKGEDDHDYGHEYDEREASGNRADDGLDEERIIRVVADGFHGVKNEDQQQPKCQEAAFGDIAAHELFEIGENALVFLGPYIGSDGPGGRVHHVLDILNDGIRTSDDLRESGPLLDDQRKLQHVKHLPRPGSQLFLRS